MTHKTRGDADLHHEDGSHRSTPTSANGRVLESHHNRYTAHMALHAHDHTLAGCTCPGPYTTDTTCPMHGGEDDD